MSMFRSTAFLTIVLNLSVSMLVQACAQEYDRTTSTIYLGTSLSIREDSAQVLIDPTSVAIVRDSLLAITSADGGSLMVLDTRAGRILRSTSPPVALLDSAYVSDSIRKNSGYFLLNKFSAMVKEHGEPDPSFVSFFRPQYLRVTQGSDSTVCVLTASRVPARRIITNELTWPSIVGVATLSLKDGAIERYRSFNVRDRRFPQLISFITSKNDGWWVVTYDFAPYEAKQFDSLPYLSRYDADGNQTKHCIMLPRRSAERKAYFSLHNDIIPLDHDVAATVDVVTGDVVIFDLGNDSAIEIPRDEWLKRTNIKADSLVSFLHPCRSGADEVEFVVTQSDSLRNVVSSTLVRLRMTKDDIDVTGISPTFKDTKVGPGYSALTRKGGTTQWPIRRLIYRGVQWHFVDIESR